MTAAPAEPAVFSDEMLAMDVADTLRRQPGPAVSASPAEPPDEGLRARYRRCGIALPEAALTLGLTAAGDGRFGYAPRRAGIGTGLARLYVVRRRWLPGVAALLIVAVLGLGCYFLVLRPLQSAQLRQADLELSQTLPAAMDRLYATIHEETKVQQADNDAAALRARGKAAALRGDRAGAEAAIDDLTAIRDTLRGEYQLKIVDRAGARWGFWTFPQSNAEATNYYVVVQAIDAQGNALTLPIRDEETGRTERVAIWGERVPQDVYRAVEADRADDGTIEHGLVAVKEFGFLEASYLVQTLGGRVTAVAR